ncbi:Oidioi.mRNA.OKI2018_I69.PAR.g9033.t1.cds [Oikopleura dioica]|uniref:Oidioi.mRNA.OKI2018_I69.PAR.g9033.t1.cds n=1 Tax=Oikopleura dioica TaxID=34765 RepID=A0ABN7RM42_OIKDI|nr:Oidioi.mRNA.OKI2018_I69.PAR.g9033.t1.cds [Oikopleura dioica]
MKFSAVLLAVSQAASVADLNRQVVSAQNEITKGARSDGNALLIQLLLEFYLDDAGHNTNRAPQMLNYGCFCQLLETRRVGLGTPVDGLDEICQRYQRCTQCVAHDQSGSTVNVEGEQLACNWENGRYEISFDSGTGRVKCGGNGPCGTKLCTCDDELAFELAANFDLFETAHSSLRGFEFEDECLPSSPPNGTGIRGELQCCGDYPNRFPYHDKNGGRDCCVDKVFNTDEKQCCNSGSLVLIGESC